jgi:hypothetical protein
MSGKIQNRESYIENGQFSGGVSVSPVSGSDFDGYNGDNPQFGFVAGGLYVGEQGSVTVKTVDNSVLTFVSASGFIPGLVAAVSSSSSANEIIALK